MTGRTDLELHEPAGAFERLEGHLAERLRPGLCADVFLAYGLSAPLRRVAAPSPPEPCVLPLLACRVRPEGALPRPVRGGFSVGRWESSSAPADHARAVAAVRESIAAGDVYQANLVRHLSARFAGDPAALAAALAPLAGPHGGGYLEGEGWAIASASPELFLARRGDLLVTKPIKGTRPAGEDVDGPKDAAEHVMIVDLERNDLARVCEPGSVRWPALMEQHELAGVTHLVSTVEGRVRDGIGLAEILAATFPGGSVTGAPKIAAIDRIAQLEPVGRGASMGALGVVHANGDFELSLTIRTFAVTAERIHLWVGGGIVWDSEPEAELEETWVKARPLLHAIGSAAPGLSVAA